MQQNQQVAKMKKTCWVYILRNKTGEITIGFSVDMDEKFTEISTRKEKLYYLRPFEEPFDGLAHKHLLIPFPKIRSTFSYNVIGNGQKYTRKSSGKRSYYTFPKITKRISNF